MPASTFQKKALYFLVFSSVVIAVLVALPLFEGWLQDNFLPRFALKISDGRLLKIDNTDAGMMSTTAVSLVLNIFRLVKVFLWMALVISAIRFISFLIFEVAFKHSGSSEISSLFKTVLSIIIYIVAFFIVFQSQYPTVQLAPLFTGSAILGIVVGLALQDTLGNLFAGIALQADQPFQVGDVVAITNRGSGVVEAVSWRGVKIRTFQNKLLVISNAVLGKETIEVAPRENLNARLVYFSTIYSASPAKTAALVRDSVRNVENISQKIRPIVRIRNLGESGLEWEVKFWVEDYSKFNDTDALVRERIWYVFQREKIGIPFPTRTVHIEERPKEISTDERLDATSEQLSRVSIFAPLSEDELEKLAAASVGRVFARGETIVRRGQEGKSMFVITRGTVSVQIPENNHLRIINNLTLNDFFGEMSLLTGQPRTANVVADEETEVLEIKKSAIKPLFEANPALMKHICEIVEKRRELLKPAADTGASTVDQSDHGFLGSIKKFFGMR